MLVLGISAVGAQAVADGMGPGIPGGGRGGHGAGREVITVVAEQTGLTPLEILTQLRAGTSLSDIISANGGDLETVTSAAIAAVTANINQAVTDGWITQEQADTMLANVETRVTDVLSGEAAFGTGGRGEGRGGRGGRHGFGGPNGQTSPEATPEASA
jgi:hypothetical protein